MYLNAEKATADDEMYELHVNADCASIIYSGGYEDRYKIVNSRLDG